jgi:hypothetical protein
MEQSLRLRRLTDLLPDADKADIITLLLALQRQCFCLTNTTMNLISKWPTPPPLTEADAASIIERFKQHD